MAVPQDHKLCSIDLNDEELLEMKDIYKFVKNFF
jgi:hypothetical protein